MIASSYMNNAVVLGIVQTKLFYGRYILALDLFNENFNFV